MLARGLCACFGSLLYDKKLSRKVYVGFVLQGGGLRAEAVVLIGGDAKVRRVMFHAETSC